MEKCVKIKKYGNRRFYSSDEKKYITLAEIQKLILKGTKVLITDAETDQDITSDILTQILLEQGRATHLPVELLEQMIRTSEKSLNAIWAPMMSQQFKIMTQMGEMALQGFKSLITPSAATPTKSASPATPKGSAVPKARKAKVPNK